MKKLSALVLLIVAFQFSPVLAQKRLPSWVPGGAAKEALRQWIMDARISPEASQDRLEDPRKIVFIDYESYEPGTDIMATFRDYRGMYRDRYSFSIYVGDQCVGIIEVYFKDQKWQWGSTGSAYNGQDVLAPIFKKYSPSDSTVIYQGEGGDFLIVQNNKVIDAFYLDFEAKAYRSVDPVQYMLKRKAEVIENRKSDYYKKSQEELQRLKNQQRDSSQRAPMFSFSPLLAQEQFPSWVPADAVKAAWNEWMHTAEIKKGDWLYNNHGITFEEACTARLANPRKVVLVDYESYEPGSNLLDAFRDYEGWYKDRYGFSVFVGTRRVGDVEVCLRDGKWIMGQISATRDEKDVLAPVFTKYPPSDSTVIYQEEEHGFFIMRQGKITDAFYDDRKARAYTNIDPAKYMTEEKTRQIELKKSDYYKKMMEQLEKARKKQKMAPRDSSQRAPLAPSTWERGLHRGRFEPELLRQIGHPPDFVGRLAARIDGHNYDLYEVIADQR